MHRVLCALSALSAHLWLSGAIQMRDMRTAPTYKSDGTHLDWVDTILSRTRKWDTTLDRCSNQTNLLSAEHAAPGPLNESALGPLDRYTDVPEAWIDWIEAQHGVPCGPGCGPASSPPGRGQHGQPLTLPEIPVPGDAAAFPRTEAKCERAFGANDSSYTCRFSNLYAAMGRLTAHFVAGQYVPDGQMNIITQAGNPGQPLNRELQLHVHPSEEAFQQFMRGRQIDLAQYKNFTGATVLFVPQWSFNIGHALYDGLYPAFVALLQWKEHQSPFRVFLRGWGVPPQALPKIEHKLPGAFQANAEVMGLIAGSGYLRDEWFSEDPDYQDAVFETFVLGMGWNGQKLDMNSNFSIGGGRELDATRHYRERVYKAVGIKPEVATHRSPRAEGLQGIIINNKRWAKLSIDWIDSVVKAVASHKVKLQLINWGKMYEAGHQYTAHASADEFVEQMRLISRTDIHISSPGTAMMYQHFLRDGSVHINLARHPYFPMRYMEEYMAEGAPYIRALYYWPKCGSRQYEADEIVRLVLEARRLIVESPFEIPVPVGANLSPVLQLAKGYLYATQRPADLAGKVPVHLMSPKLHAYSVELRNYFPHELLGQCVGHPNNRKNLNMCLWRALEQDFGAPFPGREWCKPLLGGADMACLL